MILIENNQSFKQLEVLPIEKLVAGFLQHFALEDWDISLIFVDAKTSTDLNFKYRYKNSPANVLSFPAQEFTPGLGFVVDQEDDRDLGDIIICPEKVAADAQVWNLDFTDNLERMIAHGFLHLLGYDHQTDTEHAIMTNLEEKLIGRKIEACDD